MRSLLLTLALLAVVVLGSAQAAEWTLTGRVVAVADGDTLTVLDDTKRQHKIRLAGIDAPERRQAFGQRSRERLGKLVHQKRVEARCHKIDRYKREVCAVFQDSRDVGLRMVGEGMAWWYREYANEQSAEDQKLYESAEDTARTARRGLWYDKTPIPPWEWRRKR
jgi:endonuclease YncB( thermonuclease family)